MRVQCCEFDTCSLRRIHHEQPDTPRGVRYFEIPDDASGPFFCSLTCAMYAGFMSVKYEDDTVGIGPFTAKYPDWKTRWREGAENA